MRAALDGSVQWAAWAVPVVVARGEKRHPCGTLKPYGLSTSVMPPTTVDAGDGPGVLAATVGGTVRRGVGLGVRIGAGVGVGEAATVGVAGPAWLGVGVACTTTGRRGPPAWRRARITTPAAARASATTTTTGL